MPSFNTVLVRSLLPWNKFLISTLIYQNSQAADWINELGLQEIILTLRVPLPCFILTDLLYHRRVPINYLLVNLAVADIMFASFITPQYILSHTFTHPDGVTGTVLCRLLTGGNFAWVGAASSVFTLANISIERYYAVMYPLGNKGNLTQRKLMVSEWVKVNFIPKCLRFYTRIYIWKWNSRWQIQNGWHYLHHYYVM